MLIFLIHSFVALFVEGEVASYTDEIDIILRTTLGSLFGFFISSVSVKINEENKSRINRINARQQMDRIYNNKDKRNLKYGKVCSYQILILTGICVFCFFTITIIRNFPMKIMNKDSAVATVIQYRDFLSSGVGALIGISKNSK